MILQDYCPNLLNLICLRVRAVALKVDHLLNPLFSKDMMASARPLRKTKRQNETPQIQEGDVGIRGAAQEAL